MVTNSNVPEGNIGDCFLYRSDKNEDNSKFRCLANIYDLTIYQFPTRCMMSIVIIWKPKFLLIQQAGGVT